MKKLILFDFDGTVIDNSEGIFNCINYATDKMGLPRADACMLRRFVGPSLYDSFRRFFRDNGELAEEFVKNYRERYAPIGHTECVMYAGIKETLEHLRHDGFITAVCSGKPIAFVEKIVKLLGIDGLFSGLYCPGFANCSSDKAELISAAIEHSGVSKEETLMIGDTVFDIRSAKKAGVESMGVYYGFSEPGELEKEGADMTVSSPAEIYTRIVSERDCVIFGAGEYGDSKPTVPENALVIAADAGYLRCLEYGIKPDMVIGDFDSLGAFPENADCEILRLPVEKDDTDTGFAVDTALKKGCRRFTFYGCLGGRTDMTLANIQILKKLTLMGIKACMYGGSCIITAVKDGTSALQGEAGKGVSVFSLTDRCEGVYLKGLKYSLDNAVLTDTYPLGVSNEMKETAAYVTVKNGILLTVCEV